MMNYYCPTCRREHFSREMVTFCQQCGDGGIQLAHISNIQQPVQAVPEVHADLVDGLTLEEIQIVQRLVKERFDQVLHYCATAAQTTQNIIEAKASQYHAEKLMALSGKLSREVQRKTDAEKKKLESAA